MIVINNLIKFYSDKAYRNWKKATTILQELNIVSRKWKHAMLD
jgi:hypothetical protein